MVAMAFDIVIGKESHDILTRTGKKNCSLPRTAYP